MSNSGWVNEYDWEKRMTKWLSKLFYGESKLIKIKNAAVSSEISQNENYT